jgi:hypothetical protein
MRLIHVARKPLAEATVARNILKHGTGGLNVDAGRIAYESEEDFERTKVGFDLNDVAEGWSSFSHGGQRGRKRSGRWPANLILEHREGCQLVGYRTVQNKAGTIPVATRAAPTKTEHIYGAYSTRPFKKYGDDGVETVDAWNCHPDCPVLDLDRGTASTPPHHRRDAMSPTTHDAPAKFGYSEKRHQFTYGDQGNVSRFFKQVGGRRK